MYNSEPIPSGQNDNFQILIVGIVVLAIILWRWFLRNKPVKGSLTESLIISMYGYGTTLMPVTKGVIGGYPYYLMVSEDKLEATGDEHPVLPGSVILMIDLPFSSPAHIAGFGLQDQSFKQALGNSSVDNSLEQVELEGDFPNYFRLYCEPDRGNELREVLDPSAMAFLVDYCRRMQWEIIGHSLYFAQSSRPSSSSGSENAVEDAELFVQKILPQIQKIKPANL